MDAIDLLVAPTRAGAPVRAAPPLAPPDPAADEWRSIANRSGISGRPGARHRRLSVLVAGDVVGVVAAALLGLAGYAAALALLTPHSSFRPLDALNGINAVAMFVVPLFVILGGGYAAGHYTRFKPFWTELAEFLRTGAVAVAAGAFILFAADAHFSRLWFAAFWVLVLVFVPLGRRAGRRALIRRGLWFRPVLIVGTGPNALATRQALESEAYVGMKVVGFVSAACGPRAEAGAVAEVGAAVAELEAIYGTLDVLYAPDDGTGMDLFSRLLDGPLARVRSVTLSPPAYGLPLYGAVSTSLLTHDTVLLSLNGNLGTRWKRLVKRAFDVAVGSLLLVLLAPVMGAIALALRLEGGPVFYASRRVGRDGREFGCHKFRSMVVDADAALERHLARDPAARAEWRRSFKLVDDPRTTSTGRFLRRTSLDELPQLLNVVRGDMSLVGPRPILPEEARTYGAPISLYHVMRPGMTGLWQVCGRSGLTQERRVKLNVWYARNWSLWLDIVILLKTLPVVTRGSGAS